MSAPGFAFGYARVSTGRQGSEGLSLDDQRERITAWAKAHGYELRAFERDMVSGCQTRNRDGLERALEAVCREKGTLVVYDLSRLARSLPDAVNILGRITKAGGNLACIVEGIDTATATGELIYGILAAVNSFVARAGRERTRAIMEYKRSRGEYIGGQAPYGWRVKDGALVEDKDEQRVIRMVRYMKVEGLACAVIAQRLNSTHVPCRGSVWHAKTVSRILSRKGVAA